MCARAHESGVWLHDQKHLLCNGTSTKGHVLSLPILDDCLRIFSALYPSKSRPTHRHIVQQIMRSLFHNDSRRFDPPPLHGSLNKSHKKSKENQNSSPWTQQTLCEHSKSSRNRCSSSRPRPKPHKNKARKMHGRVQFWAPDLVNTII